MQPQSETRWSAPLAYFVINAVLLQKLAEVLVAGNVEVDQVTARLTQALGQDWAWVRPLAGRYVAAYTGQTRPRRRDVVAFLKGDAGLRRAFRKWDEKIRVDRWIRDEPRMQPVARAAMWDVPEIETEMKLAEWLRLSSSELEWLADLKLLGCSGAPSSRWQNYHYRTVTKRSGEVRLIESPQSLLKTLQRQVLSQILDCVPAHEAVHGFVKGRSIKTFAEPHTGQGVVLRVDLKDFFPSIRRERVQSVFRTVGYPERVADLLGGLCTNVAPRWVFGKMRAERGREMRKLYGQSHLPQGAPSSPSMANICAYRMDCRLSGLAKAAGGTYTRYADDLAFSGTEAFERGVNRFAAHVAAIAIEEGFAVQHRKTRVMRRGVRQHLAGLVVNERPSVPRDELDRLKATLTNCVRKGWRGENHQGLQHFREHLNGRVAFVSMVRPERGAKLRGIFERIDWD